MMNRQECWDFLGHKNIDGYGMQRFEKKVYRAHQVAYKIMIGQIPNGLEIDHLCRNRACVNPDHLEAVTHFENMLRGDTFTRKQSLQTHCKRGHPFNESNTRTYLHKNGRPYRQCQVCRKWRSNEIAVSNEHPSDGDAAGGGVPAGSDPVSEDKVESDLVKPLDGDPGSEH